ncbi:hypothetical protein FACS1894153_4040 [Bacteroidia bacterium]|nr:hypothetical protein FACS1894153_4040 [Bacteroidia bacterium]
MTKKKIIYILCFIFAISKASAESPIPNYFDETKVFRFGYLLGYNQMNFSVKMQNGFKDSDSIYGLEGYSKPGFSVGIITEVRLDDYWYIRSIPTLSLGSRQLKYLVHDHKTEQIKPVWKNIESTIVDIPFEIKWNAKRLKNYRPYVIAGVKYSIDLASNARKKSNEEEDVMVKLLPTEFAAFTGVGFEFYFPFNNRIAVELKTSFGLTNIMKFEDNIYTNCVDKLTSNNTFISITFGHD